MRTALLGLLGLVLAVAVGFGVHLVTRSTISLPVVQLEPSPALAPPPTTTDGTTERPATERDTSGPPVSTSAGTEAETETDDGPGRGRGRGRSGGDSGSSGSGSGSSGSGSSGSGGDDD